MNEPIHIISLGAGVQSSTMALMAAAGEITPMPTCAIFADTQAEPKSVYVWLDWLEKQLPFPVYRVTAGSLEVDTLKLHTRKDGKGFYIHSGIPHYSNNADGSKGHGQRQCTHDFKITPIQKAQRKIVGSQAMAVWRRAHKTALKLLSEWQKEDVQWKRAKKKASADHLYFKSPRPPMPWDAFDECQTDPLIISWIGISMDEVIRKKPSRVFWINNHHPLIERRITRKGCLSWMQDRKFPIPPRSACVFCPYHDDHEWRRLKEDEPLEFARAVNFDEEYRRLKIQTVSKKGFVPFLHDSRIPLKDVDFAKPSHEEQDLFNNECEGMCGV